MKKLRPVCPLCVSRYCPNCDNREVVNRKWLEVKHPSGGCRWCGAISEALTIRPVRHTNAALREEHVQEFLRKPVRRIDRSPIDIAEALDLLHTLDGVFFKAYSGARWLPTDDDRDRRMDEEHKARNWNEGTSDLLALVAVVRRWVAENTEPDGG